MSSLSGNYMKNLHGNSVSVQHENSAGLEPRADAMPGGLGHSGYYAPHRGIRRKLLAHPTSYM